MDKSEFFQKCKKVEERLNNYFRVKKIVPVHFYKKTDKEYHYVVREYNEMGFPFERLYVIWLDKNDSPNWGWMN
jgi:hypothetical protein